MAILNIVTSEDEVLRKKCRPVEKITPRTLTLLDDMLDTMRAANGVGLAAPQVGILRRIVIVDIGEGLIEMINPEIVATEGEQEGEEGCLSVPDEVGIVKRPNIVTVKAIDRNGEPFTIPEPDETVFISSYEGGEVFRSGCCFHRGNGRIFYFQPGHETFPTYYNKDVQKVIKNAVLWAKPTYRIPLVCPHVTKPEI